MYTRVGGAAAAAGGAAAAAAAGAGPNTLAYTGLNTAWMVVIALVLISAGITLMRLVPRARH